MKAIILAAGRGARMKKLTDEAPKCFAKLKGIRLIDRQIKTFKNSGISEISIVTGYKYEKFKSYSLKKFFNSKWEKTNMLSSLACAEEWLKNSTCIISYSDIFYEIKALKCLLKCKSPISITYDPNWLEIWSNRFSNPLSDAESFKLNNNSTISDIGRRVESLSEIQGQFMGLLKTSPEGWMEIQRIRSLTKSEDRDKIDMTGILQKIILSDKIPIFFFFV